MKRRGLLLDRDGVINVDHGYVCRREQFEFMPGLFPFLRKAQDLGYRLAIITNQSGVARGKYTEDDFSELTTWMLDGLAKQGVAIDLVLACFEHDDGNVSPYDRQSFWRKPNPGMLLEAMQKLRLDPTRSIFLGDKTSDIEAAKAAQIRGLLFTSIPGTTPPDVTTVRDFDDALEALI